MTLEEFAFFDPYKDWLSLLAASAEPEDWGTDHRYLRYYCETNLHLALAQNLVHFDPDERFVLWRVGHLVSQDGAPVYVLFGRNNNPNRQKWFFLTVMSRRNPVVRIENERQTHSTAMVPVRPPPREPVYDIPDYHRDYVIDYNWRHFMEDRQERVYFSLPGIDNDRVLYLSIFGAVETAHRHAGKYAVPAWYNGRYQHLMPLYITTADERHCPDLVAALDEDDQRGVYIVRTLLLPEWAYSNARAIAINPAPFQTWLFE